MNSIREQKDYYQVVNFDGQEIQVLDYVFNHGDGFKGATGTRFEPVSLAYYKDATKKANVLEYLEGAVSESEVIEQWGTQAAQYRLLEYGAVTTEADYKTALNRWYKAIKDAGEIDIVMFDNSYSHLWDYLRDELKLNTKNAYIFTCTGGGRMFDKDFQGNINPELSALIREYEK